MDPATDSWQTALDQLAQLKATWPGEPWSWDGRFSTVASAFKAELEPQVRASAVLALKRGWTTKNVENAPQVLRDIANRTGGLRAGQRLLAGEHDTLFGLWWPWGGGDQITLRIGFTSTEPVARLRALFGA